MVCRSRVDRPAARARASRDHAALAGLARIEGDCFLSVNLGPDALLDERVLDELRARDLKRIVVELTEHAPVQQLQPPEPILLELRARGLRLAVDDAGAGYASLRHVLNLAPDIIKIDISLTREFETNRGARALATALISFAGEMQQLVIAEGIERDETLDVLEALGVQYGQGFPPPAAPARLSSPRSLDARAAGAL